MWTMEGNKKMRREGNQDVSTADSLVDSASQRGTITGTSERHEGNRKTSVCDTRLSIETETQLQVDHATQGDTSEDVIDSSASSRASRLLLEMEYESFMMVDRARQEDTSEDDKSDYDKSDYFARFQLFRIKAEQKAYRKVERFLDRREYLKAVSFLQSVSEKRLYVRLLEDLFKRCIQSYSVDLDKAGMPEALSSVLYLLGGTEYASYIPQILEDYGCLLYWPHPRSSLLHAVLNVNLLYKNMTVFHLIEQSDSFLCHLLRIIEGGNESRLSFEQSRIFALHVEAAGPPLHYGPPQNYGRQIGPGHYLRLPQTIFFVECQQLFKTAVELNLYDEALLLYRTGAVCYKELHDIRQEKESKGHESVLNHHQQSPTAQFLDSVIRTPRSLFLTCTLEVASLIQRRPERAEALRGRLPQPLIDAVMFKPQLKDFEDAIMKRYSCTDVEKIFTE